MRTKAQHIRKKHGQHSSLLVFQFIWSEHLGLDHSERTRNFPKN